MQDPSGASDPSFRKTKSKPQRKQVALLQPKSLALLGNTSQTGKAAVSKVAKTPKKSARATKKASGSDEARDNVLLEPDPAVARPVVDMMAVTEGDSRSLYRALKRKYLTLEDESFTLAEELEKTEEEVKQLEEEKLALLDELLVLEGLAFNPYLPIQQLQKTL